MSNETLSQRRRQRCHLAAPRRTVPFLVLVSGLLLPSMAFAPRFRGIERNIRHEPLRKEGCFVSSLLSNPWFQESATDITGIRDKDSLVNVEPNNNNIVIRRATPEEMDNLSVMVADCFVSSTTERNGAMSTILSRWERFATRWQVYAGMLQRLLMSSFQEGLRGAEDLNNHNTKDCFNLFVAEHIVDPTKCSSESLENGEGDLDRTNVVVGVAELAYGSRPFGEEPPPNDSVPILCNLAVLPSYRNLGVGRMLVRRVIQEASNTETIWLSTEHNNVAALRLYMSEGFTCVGVDPEIRAPRNAFLMKPLGDNSKASAESIERRRNILQLIQWNGTWSPEYDLSDKQHSYMGKESFLEKNFGVLAPAIAALGTLVGIILF